MGSRLTRGRAYARQGQVHVAEVAPGKVTRPVQGSRARRTTSRSSSRRFTETDLGRGRGRPGRAGDHGAQLLAGEMPPELEEVFAERRGAAVPASGWPI